MNTNTKWTTPTLAIALALVGSACPCPHDAPPPQMGPPPVTIAPGWPKDATCFENALLWGEDDSVQAFNILIVFVPEPGRDRDQAAFDAAKNAVDTANAAFINGVNAIVAGQQGDASALKQDVTAALQKLLALAQQIEADAHSHAMRAAASTAGASNLSQAQDKLNAASKDLEFLKKH